MEELIFDKSFTNEKKKAALEQVSHIINTLQRLQDEPDMQYKFQDEVIFGALRASIVRLASMGISGFDSPVANYSLREGRATLDGIEKIIRQYEQKSHPLFSKIYTQLALAKRQLSSATFISFDRLDFLINSLDPLFQLISSIRDHRKVEIPAGLTPVNQFANSLFDPAFFNKDFFSPNERFRVTPERIELGKRLFNDPLLSGNRKRSCATCHKAELAFTDAVPTPMDIEEKGFLLRNTPTLWNSVFQTRQFYDSRTATLENQLSDVVHNSKEMKGSLGDNIPELEKDSIYAGLFAIAYKNEKEKINHYNISNAIASYIRSLVALNSRFDQYLRGEKNKLKAEEIQGFNLFMGKAKCGSCHYFPLFNGLIPPEFNETESEVLGVPQSRDSIRPVLDGDMGKYNFTRSEIQRHAFKTPTLRNVELTAPYMHNGVFQTLDEVLIFYNKGGGAGLGIAPENQTLPREKLNLSPGEIKSIIAFLKTLTDTSTQAINRK